MRASVSCSRSVFAAASRASGRVPDQPYSQPASAATSTPSAMNNPSLYFVIGAPRKISHLTGIVDEYLQVAHVRVGRARLDQAAHRIEEVVRVVVREKRRRLADAGGARALQRRRIDHAARGVGRTVDAIGPDARRDDERRAARRRRREPLDQRQRELLIPAAAPAARDAHRRLSRRNHAARPVPHAIAHQRVGSRQQPRRGVARFARDRLVHDERREPETLRFHARGGHRVAAAGDHVIAGPRQARIARLRRFVALSGRACFEHVEHRRRHRAAYAEAIDHTRAHRRTSRRRPRSAPSRSRWGRRPPVKSRPRSPASSPDTAPPRPGVRP